MPLPGAIDPTGPSRSFHPATEAASSSSFFRKEKRKNNHPPAHVSSEGPGASLHAGYPLPMPMQPTTYVHPDSYLKPSTPHVASSTDVPYPPSTASPASPTATYPVVRGRAPKGKKKADAFVSPHSPSYAIPTSPTHMVAAPLAGSYPVGSVQPLAVQHAVLAPHPSGMGRTAVAAGTHGLLPVAVTADVPAPVDAIASVYTHPHPHAHTQPLLHSRAHAHAYPYSPTAVPVAYVLVQGEPALVPVIGKNGIASVAGVASVPMGNGHGNGNVMNSGVPNTPTSPDAITRTLPNGNGNSSASMGMAGSDGRRGKKKNAAVSTAVLSASVTSLPSTPVLPTTSFTAANAPNIGNGAPAPSLTPASALTASHTATATATVAAAAAAGAVAVVTNASTSVSATVASSANVTDASTSASTPTSVSTSAPAAIAAATVTPAVTAAAAATVATVTAAASTSPATATTSAAAPTSAEAATAMVNTNTNSSKISSSLSISAPILSTPTLSSPEISLSPPAPSTAPDSPGDYPTNSPNTPPFLSSAPSSISTPYTATPPAEDATERQDAGEDVKTAGKREGACHGLVRAQSEGRGNGEMKVDVKPAAKGGANEVDVNARETPTASIASTSAESASTPLYRIPIGPTVMLTTALPRAYAHAHTSTDNNSTSTSTAVAVAAAAGVSLGVPGPGLDESVAWLWPRLGNANAKLATQHFANNAKAGGKFDHYETVAAEVKGEHDVYPLLSFDHMAMPPFLRANIAAACYQVPTPIQKWSIPLALNNHDIMACAQTGSGKTVAFLFPLFIKYAAGTIVSVRSTKLHHKHNLSFGNSRNGSFPNSNPAFAGYKPFDVDKESIDPHTGNFAPSALILSPTRELASQIYQECAKFSYRSPLRAVVVYGGKHQQNQIMEMRKGVDILIATPGRLLDYLQQELITLRRVAYLVCDEADRMLDMGFEPQIRGIVSGYDMPVHASISIGHGVRPVTHSHVQRGENDSNHGMDADQQGNHGNETSEGTVISRQTLMFSATFPAAIQALASSFLAREYVYLAIGRVGATSDLIAQQFIWVPQADKMRELVRLCSVSAGRTVVFVERKTVCDEIEQFLNHNGCRVVACHGNKTQKQREEALRLFKTGKTHTLIATDVVARGLDIPDVQLVINFDMPGTTDSYVHRIGRTGRCGNVGKSIAFINEETQSNVVVDIVEMLLSSADARAEVHKEQDKGQGKGGMGTGAKVWCESTGGLVDESVLYGNPEDQDDGKIPAFMLALYERYTVGNRRNKGKYGASGGYGYNNSNPYYNTPNNGYGYSNGGRNGYNQHGRGGYQYNNGNNIHGGGQRRQNGYGYMGNANDYGYPATAAANSGVGGGMGVGVGTGGYMANTSTNIADANSNPATAFNNAVDAGTGYAAVTPAQSYVSSNNMYKTTTRTYPTTTSNHTGMTYGMNNNGGNGGANMPYYPQIPQNTYGKGKAPRGGAPYTHPSQGYVPTPAQRGGQYDAHTHTHAHPHAQAQAGHGGQSAVHGGAQAYYPYSASTSASATAGVVSAGAGAGAATTADVDSASCGVTTSHHNDTNTNTDPCSSLHGMVSPSPVSGTDDESLRTSDIAASETSDEDDEENVDAGINGAGTGVSGYLNANGQFVPYNTQSFPCTPVTSGFPSYQYPQQQMQMQTQTHNGVVYAYAPMHTAATFYPVSNQDQRGNAHARTHPHAHYPTNANDGYNGRKQYPRRSNTHAGTRTPAHTSFSTPINGYASGMGTSNANGGGYSASAGAGAGAGDAAVNGGGYGAYPYVPQSQPQQQSLRGSGKSHQGHVYPAPTHYPQHQPPHQHQHQQQQQQQQHGGSQRGAQHRTSSYSSPSLDGYPVNDAAQPHMHAHGLNNHNGRNSGNMHAGGGGGGRGASRASQHGNGGAPYTFNHAQSYPTHANTHAGHGNGGVGTYTSYQQPPTQYYQPPPQQQQQ